MPTVSVRPEILVWARETARLTPEEAVKKLQLPDARGVPAVQRLAALETGEVEPTRPMLVKMAKQYRRPLLTFYLSAPPRQADRGVDFRRLPDDHPLDQEAVLDALLRNVRARQSMVRAALEEEDEAEPLPFVGSRKISDGQPVLLKELQKLIGVDRSQYHEETTPRNAFRMLRTHAESAGVFVLLKGDVGSHHTALDVDVFRGFAIADEVAPFVVINSGDAEPARSFTLLHELVHLLLGQTGVSGAESEIEIEKFCNDVASEFLLSAHELKDLDFRKTTNLDVVAERIGEFARDRNLSLTMVAYTAYRKGVITWEAYNDLKQKFHQQWHDRPRESKKRGAPNFYVVRRHRIGEALLHLIPRMMGVGALSTSKAAKILDVRPKQVQHLLLLDR